jgi:short-subunit dehydrogenase
LRVAAVVAPPVLLLAVLHGLALLLVFDHRQHAETGGKSSMRMPVFSGLAARFSAFLMPPPGGLCGVFTRAPSPWAHHVIRKGNAMANDLANTVNTALITGASSGIGLELARCFVEDGYNIVIVSDNADKLDRAANLLRAEYADAVVETIVCDLSTPEGPRELYAEAKRRGLEPDTLVNNVGVGVFGDFARETDLGDEIRMINLNLVTPTILAKLFVQDMLKHGQGKILFTASVASATPAPNLLVYSATKAYVYHLAEGLRQELKDTGITVTALLPGETNTNFFARAGMQGTETMRRQQEHRMDDPADVARAGYEALMAGDDHVVVSMKNKLQVAAAKLMPKSTAAGQATVK